MIDLTAARIARRPALDDVPPERRDHPVLRWVAGSVFYVAHRKDGRTAACGADGSLVLAPPGVPLCVTCYPPPSERKAT